MAPSIPAPLCTLILSTGKRCGSPALRGKRFCYHHSRNHLDHTRDRRIARRLERLSVRLDSMSTAELLQTLHRQLGTLPKTLSRYPEVSCTLNNALGRLKAIITLESILYEYKHHNQKFASYLTRVAPESTTSTQDRQNQQPGPEIQNRPLNPINNLANPTGSSASIPETPVTRSSHPETTHAPQTRTSAPSPAATSPTNRTAPPPPRTSPESPVASASNSESARPSPVTTPPEPAQTSSPSQSSPA